MLHKNLVHSIAAREIADVFLAKYSMLHYKCIIKLQLYNMKYFKICYIAEAVPKEYRDAKRVDAAKGFV